VALQPVRGARVTERHSLASVQRFWIHTGPRRRSLARRFWALATAAAPALPLNRPCPLRMCPSIRQFPLSFPHPPLEAWRLALPHGLSPSTHSLELSHWQLFPLRLRWCCVAHSLLEALEVFTPPAFKERHLAILYLWLKGDHMRAQSIYQRSVVRWH